MCVCEYGGRGGEEGRGGGEGRRGGEDVRVNSGRGEERGG